MSILAGINILEDDPYGVSGEAKEWWIGELQSRIRDLCGADGKRKQSLANLQGELGITNFQSGVLFELSRGSPVTKDFLISTLGSKLVEEYCVSNGGSGYNNINAQISKMRKTLPDTIEVKTVWGVGYQCPPESCAEIKRIMNGRI